MGQTTAANPFFRRLSKFNPGWEEMLNKLRALLSDEKARKRILFGAMILTFIIGAFVLLSSKRPSSKFESVLMCTKCHAVETREADDLYKEACSKCKAPMGLAYKCDECRYEFPYLPSDADYLKKMDIEEYRKFRVNEAKCPNCFSTKTHGMDPK